MQKFSSSKEIIKLQKECQNWRNNKKHKFEPMPINLQKYISSIAKSKKFSNSQIINATKINNAKLKKLLNKQFDDSSNNDPEIDLIPFNFISNNKTNNQTISQNSNSNSNSNHLTINSANGDSISIPLTLNEFAVQNIIKIFLCCK